MDGQGESDAAAAGEGPTPPSAQDQAQRIRAILALGGVPWDDLEDGLQQVRLKLLTEETRPGRSIRNRAAWTAAVASRVAVDWHRAKTREANLRARLAARWGRDPTPEHVQEDVPLALAVADCLDSLSRHQCQVIVLRYYMDLSVPDIASLLGIPEGTVKSQLHTAAAALRGRLVEQEVSRDGRA